MLSHSLLSISLRKPHLQTLSQVFLSSLTTAAGSPPHEAFHTCLSSCRKPANFLQSLALTLMKSPLWSWYRLEIDFVYTHLYFDHFVSIYISLTLSPPWFVSCLLSSQGSQCFISLCWLCRIVHLLQTFLLLTPMPSIISSFSTQTRTTSFLSLLSLNLTWSFKGKTLFKHRIWKCQKSTDVSVFYHDIITGHVFATS